MIIINKPTKEDLEMVRKILLQWTEKSEADKYIDRIKKEIGGTTEFNMHFWVAKNNGKAIGVVGLADPLPKVLPLAKTKNPGELKILYLYKKEQGKGIGKFLVDFVEEQAKKQGYSELLVRSAERYRDTAYGFYKNMGYKTIGVVSGSEKSKLMQVFSKKL